MHLTFGEDGGPGTVTITTAPGCAWSATPSAAWIVVTGGASGDGPGTVAYLVAANPAVEGRDGTLTIEDQRHTIAQSGQSPTVCRYDLVPERAEVGPDAADGTFAVQTSSGCAWSATSTASWLVVGAGGQGAGNGNVSYAVARNPGVDARRATVAVADQTFTVQQSGDIRACQVLGGTSGVPAVHGRRQPDGERHDGDELSVDGDLQRILAEPVRWHVQSGFRCD